MSSSHARRWRCRRTGRCIASIASIALLAAAASPAAGHAVGVPATDPFGLTPMPAPDGQPRPYFSLTVKPGRSVRDIAIISNEGTRTERLRVTISKGVTAANSGSAFEDNAGKCTGASCWVTGLPAVVTLTPGARKALTFRIAVPARTRRGQYLAGITASPAIRPRAVRVGITGHASARAIIIDQVTVGVAVTVGPLARLRTLLTISTVSAGWIGTTPRLYIPVRNQGRTFVQAAGDITCRSGGRRHSYRIIMETVLPGGRAVLPINAPGLNSGEVPCTVRLHDSAGNLVTWSGIVSVPAQTLTKTYHPAKGVYISRPEGTVPPWAVALMVIGALILASLLTLLAQRRRHLAHPARRASSRRRRPGSPARPGPGRRRGGGPSAARTPF